MEIGIISLEAGQVQATGQTEDEARTGGEN
jgi:hypothetical protein